MGGRGCTCTFCFSFVPVLFSRPGSSRPECFGWRLRPWPFGSRLRPRLDCPRPMSKPEVPRQRGRLRVQD